MGQRLDANANVPGGCTTGVEAPFLGGTTICNEVAAEGEVGETFC